MLKQGKEGVVVNTSSMCGLVNSANSPTGFTPVNYTVAKNGVTLITESLDAAMRSRNAPISVHALCPFDTASEGLVSNVTKRMTKEQQEEFAKVMKNMLPTASLVDILLDSIERGRFYCVTPDGNPTSRGTGSINLSRAWMLQRAEDFINDRPPLSPFRKEGAESFKELQKQVEARAKGPIHKL